MGRLKGGFVSEHPKSDALRRIQQFNKCAPSPDLARLELKYFRNGMDLEVDLTKTQATLECSFVASASSARC